MQKQELQRSVRDMLGSRMVGADVRLPNQATQRRGADITRGEKREYV